MVDPTGIPAGSTTAGAALKLLRNPTLDEPLERALLDLWARVTNAGGAVGFLPPVEAEDIAQHARGQFERVRQGTDDLVVARIGGDVVGFGFLATSSTAVKAHLGTIERLQRAPDAGGLGIGAAVLAELEEAAWDRGLDLVALTVRGGGGREGFYLRQGYRLDATLTGRLRLADGSMIEEHHMSKPRPGTAADDEVLRIQRLDPGLPLPRYAHPGDAGLDLHARESIALAPGDRAVVPTGIAVEMPLGLVGLVHPRSGLAARHGVGLVNAPGTIDAGYRGEIKVILVNWDRSETAVIERGDRVAQLLIQPVERRRILEVEELRPSPRGDGGFGSSGR